MSPKNDPNDKPVKGARYSLTGDPVSSFDIAPQPTNNHTPGLWHRDGHCLSSIIHLLYPIGHPKCKHTTGTYEKIAECVGDNWSANSKLIAAAPTMFFALEEVIADALHLSRQESLLMEYSLNLAHKAIAKAKGE